MQQSEEETLEDYLERFLYNYQKFKQRLNTNTVRTIFLKRIWMNILIYLTSWV